MLWKFSTGLQEKSQIEELFHRKNRGEIMKTKVVDYDNIVTVHNGEEYHHGQITYSDYKSSNGVDLLRLNIDMALCILPDEQENFLKEISDLVNQYSK